MARARAKARAKVRARRRASSSGNGVIGTGRQEAVEEILSRNTALSLRRHDPDQVQRVLRSIPLISAAGCDTPRNAGMLGKFITKVKHEVTAIKIHFAEK
jgi:hypothetical protein